MRKWLIAVLLAAAPAASAQPLPARAYAVADGLAHDRVKRVVADSRGLLWFCTAEGLGRFDGTRFTTYREAQGLPFDSVNDLLETRAGDYWLATNGRGVARLADGVTFAAVAVGESAATNRVNVVHEDGAGRIWAGTDAGLFSARVAQIKQQPQIAQIARIEPRPQIAQMNSRTNRPWMKQGQAAAGGADDGFRLVTLAGSETGFAAEPQVWAVAESAGHGLLVGTEAGLVAVRTDARSEQVSGPASTSARSALSWGPASAGPAAARVIPIAGARDRAVTALLARGDRVWIGHSSGLALLAADAGAATPVAATDDAVQALVERDGRIWAGTLGGELLAVDAATGLVAERHPGAARSGILSIAVDGGRRLWLGTRADGALRLLDTALVPFAEREGLPPQPVRGILESRRGDIYVVSLRPSGPLFVLDGARFVEVPAPRVADAPPQVILQDRRGGWWMGSARGLARFAPAPSVAALRAAAPLATYTTRNGLPHGNVLTLFEDSAARLWVGGWAVGHATFIDPRDQAVRNIAAADAGLPALQPNAFAEDRGGNVWIGGRNGEIARYRRDRLEPIATPRPLHQITGMHVDRAGRLWVSSAAGLFRIDAPAAEQPRFVPIGGLASSITRFVVEDAHGRFYVGLPSGVNRLDPNTGVVEFYTPADGLRGLELTTSLRDRTGHLWFGTHNGVTRLAPAADTVPPPDAQAYIGGVHVAGMARPTDLRGATEIGPLDLDWTQNTVAIDYFAVTYRAGETPAFRYRLEGADQEWSAPTASTTVTYAGLRPGRYRFAVQPVTATGAAATASALVGFVIRAPFWQRGWFIALAAAALAAVTWMLYRARVARLLAVERLRTRIATDLHDDIGASLSRITILSEVANQRLAASHIDERQMLGTIADTARATIEAMSDIVWTISPDRDSVHDLASRMREFASDQLAARAIDFTFDTPAAGLHQALGLTLRRELLLIFKEAVTNAARHADATAVHAALSLAGSTLRLEVTDNGHGFAAGEARAREGNGLGNMARRAAAVGGRLEVDSSARGTSIVVSAQL